MSTCFALLYPTNQVSLSFYNSTSLWRPHPQWYWPHPFPHLYPHMTSIESASLLMKLSKKSKLFNMGGSMVEEASVLLVGVLLMRWNLTLFLDLVRLGVGGFFSIGGCSFCNGLLLMLAMVVLGSLVFFDFRFRNRRMICVLFVSLCVTPLLCLVIV